jgi:hypothetical protein
MRSVMLSLNSTAVAAHGLQVEEAVEAGHALDVRQRQARARRPAWPACGAAASRAAPAASRRICTSACGLRHAAPAAPHQEVVERGFDKLRQVSERTRLPACGVLHLLLQRHDQIPGMAAMGGKAGEFMRRPWRRPPRQTRAGRTARPERPERLEWRACPQGPEHHPDGSRQARQWFRWHCWLPTARRRRTSAPRWAAGHRLKPGRVQHRVARGAPGQPRSAALRPAGRATSSGEFAVTQAPGCT